MNQHKSKKQLLFTRKSCVVATEFALAMMAAPLAFGQASPPAAVKIEVTGSRIPLQQNVESHSPIAVISADDIKIEGNRNVESLLNNMPQVFADQNATISNGATGMATVNLRGLGSDRTLVLMNGRRLPIGSPQSGATSPDLNQIPVSLIKRIEILTGGASAVYGSDAIAGVVNFIMNDKFEGVQLDLNWSAYNHKQQNTGQLGDVISERSVANPNEFKLPGDKSSDGRVGDIGITIGSNFANGKGNGTFFFGYKDQQTLLQSERDFSACAIGPPDASGRYTCGGSGTSATGRVTNLANGQIWTTTDANGTARRYNNALDQYNFGPTNFWQRPSERYNSAAFVNYDINDHVRVYGEFNFADDLSIAQVAPGGIFGNIATIHGDNPLLSASWRTALGLTNSNASTTDVVIQRRNVEGGGRQSEFRHTSFREVVGVKGDVGKWNYDVFAENAKVIYSQVQKNYFLNERIDRALDVVNVNGVATCASVVNGSDPNCVPYNVWALGAVTPAMLNYIQAPGFQKGSTQQSFYGATISADLGDYGWRVPNAKNGLAFAAGIERRTEKLENDSDVAVTTGALSGSGGPTPPIAGKYTVDEIYGELRVPIIQGQPMFEDLSVSGSYRHSSYSTDVDTNTYGVGIDWSPTKQVKLRGSYQSAVRAPNIIELFQAQGNNLFDMNADPCGGPTPTATRAQCANTGVTAAQYGNIQNSPAGQYNFLQGGNPQLNPEEAKSYTVGLVFTPSTNLSATLDWFDIKVDKRIATPDPADILNRCLTSGTDCGLVHRDRLGTLWLLDDGRVTATRQNQGGIRTSGLDIAVNWTTPLQAGWGSVGVSFIGTWLSKLEYEPIKDQGKYDCVGLYGANKCGSPNPEWRHKLRGTWTTPWNWDLNLTWRYIDEVKVQESDSQTLLAGSFFENDKKLKAENYIDIAASWQVTKWIRIYGGVNNLFDEDPPVTTQQGASVFGNGNTFPGVYDSLGRKIFVGTTLKF